MTYSDPNLWIFVAFIPLTVAAIATASWLCRRHGGALLGWGGALFIGLCWIAALGLIVHRLFP